MRVTHDFDDHKLWLAASLESPQASYFPASPTAVSANGTVDLVNPGGIAFAPTVNYSSDVAPDVIVKAAADPGWGHYELSGIMRFLHDRVSTLGSGENHITAAGGGGGSFVLPLIRDKLVLVGNALAGVGIGRYASGLLPDATIDLSGKPVPLPRVHALIGLVGHPTPSIDLYAYAGTEQTRRYFFNIGSNPYGYGNPLYSNAGCGIELSPLPCNANTKGIVQGSSWRLVAVPPGKFRYVGGRRAVFVHPPERIWGLRRRALDQHKRGSNQPSLFAVAIVSRRPQAVPSCWMGTRAAHAWRHVQSDKVTPILSG